MVRSPHAIAKSADFQKDCFAQPMWAALGAAAAVAEGADAAEDVGGVAAEAATKLRFKLHSIGHLRRKPNSIANAASKHCPQWQNCCAPDHQGTRFI